MTLHTHGLINSLDFYGSYLGIQEKYKYIISDDIEFLSCSSFFNDNINTLFTLENINLCNFNNDSRSNKLKLRISKNNHNISSISIHELITDDISNENNDNDIDNYIIYNNNLNKNSKSNNDSDSENSSIAYTTDSENDESSSESIWETDSDEDSDEDSLLYTDDSDNEQYAYINNFPVQMICIEKCDGTFDDLFTTNSISIDIAASALMQIIMSLIAFQHMFSFTHNDLHTNNVMYINTDIEFIYYKFDNLIYKVPTHGKIYKIIDFGRSIYKFNKTIYCSDSFAPSGDANSQYNIEPFFNDSKPRLEPNMSFDLCRLGCSIYDFIIPDDNINEYDELQKTIYRWCLDDNDKNLLYKKNGQERYPEFKLYKMIARTVHNHTPQNQLKFDFFKQFLYDKDDATNLIDIDILPSYI